MMQSTWFVRAAADQRISCLQHGLWTGHALEDAQLKQIHMGDRIVLHSISTRQQNLPFDAHGQSILVLEIHALGEMQQYQQGQGLQIAWHTQYATPREWYFYAHRGEMWQVTADHWMNQALLAFVFEGQAQNYTQFITAPYWQEQRRLQMQLDSWQQFYLACAQALLSWRERRAHLLDFALQIAQQHQLSYMLNKPFTDICPFTIMGMFNRGISTQKRIAIAQAWQQFLKLEVAVPQIFDGIPILNNQKSWFFSEHSACQAQDIERLWQFFALAQHYADQGHHDIAQEQAFSALYDQVSAQDGIGWNLSMGLFWLRPHYFMSLDSQSQQYIRADLGLAIPTQGAKGRCSGEDYLSLLKQLEYRFQQPYSLVRSFSALSLQAWEQQGAIKSLVNDNDDDLNKVEQALHELPVQRYDVSQIQAEGGFLAEQELLDLLTVLKHKKNLILQGPTGTGKTWLAKRLAYALIGHKSQDHVNVLQFHPNTSYEDFIRGWRPQLDAERKHSELVLVDGPFLMWIQKALKYPNDQFVMVIEEINRGQPAQIFGEMLTLLEASKRHPHEALALNYAKPQEKVYIPPNVYVIGTMNVADRSLTHFDLALRRRFAFVHLAPKFNRAWQNYVAQFGIDQSASQAIATVVQALNDELATEPHLGKACLIGHSYFTPNQAIEHVTAWYTHVIDLEIIPLLEDYWFDQPERIQLWQQRLLEAL